MKSKVMALALGLGLGCLGFSTIAVSQAAMAQTDSTNRDRPVPLPPFANTEWLLEDLGGKGVIDNLQTTLRFNGANQISGMGGCNRYFSSAQINGDHISVGAISSTKRLCTPAVMNQETGFFRALESADRITLDGPYLLMYTNGLEKPLKFTRR